MSLESKKLIPSYSRCSFVFITALFFYVIGTVRKHHYQYVPNRRAQKCRFSECNISGPTAPREIRSNDLDSPWASDHLYIHQIICFTVTILQHSIKASTGKRDLRLGKLRKSVGSFCIRCGLGWTADGLCVTISSWTVYEKTLKNIIFWVEKLLHIALFP